MHRILVGAATCLAALHLAAPGHGQDELPVANIKPKSGYNRLYLRTGGNPPTGAGVEVAQSEPISNPGYQPNVNDPEFIGKTFIFHAGTGWPATHATLAGRRFYGLDTGISPGPTVINSYWDMTGSAFLNGQSSTPPNIVTWKVAKSSRHPTTGADANTLLRKMDYAINTQDLVIVNSPGNSALPHVKPLFSHTFNDIVVGTSGGKHRHGPTLTGYDGEGRQKPDMVAPQPMTSYSMPLVAGAATVLIEAARTYPGLAGNPRAEHSETVKACLMAGAEHHAGWANNAPQSGPTRGLATEPLDALYGADEIDIDHAHWILTGGEHDAAASAASAVDTRHNGWDFFTIPQGESRFWRFQIEAAKPYASILLTWNRSVAADFQSWEMADIDMELFEVDGQGTLISLVGDPGLSRYGSGNTRSESDVDNVEHIYAIDLQPGEYMLVVARDPDGLVDYDAAVAWEFQGLAPVTYGTAKTTSTGLIPSMRANGYPSAAEDDFEITVANAEPNKNGMFFYGTNGRKNKPFKGGLMLVEGPLTRTSLMTTSAEGDISLQIPVDALMVGQQRNYQFWFRDPASPKPYGLSDAVEVVFWP